MLQTKGVPHVLMDVTTLYDVVSQGVEVFCQLSVHPALVRLPPVIAMTANATPADRERYRAAGFANTLGKPFSGSALTAMALEAVQPSPSTPT